MSTGKLLLAGMFLSALSVHAAEIQSDLQTYQDKYQRGQIRNDVVKPAPGQ